MRRMFLFSYLLSSVLFAPLSGAADHCLNPNPASAFMTKTTPESRFTLPNLGDPEPVVSDNATGLMWQYCAVGHTWNGSSCSPGATPTYTWLEALTSAVSNGASYAGKTGWRVPNVKELSSIVERTCASPALNKYLFPGTPGGMFWTSTVFSGGTTTNAWSVNFATGAVVVNLQTTPGAVRLVRDLP